MIQNKNIKLILNYFCGPLVFCILLFSIYHQLRGQSNWSGSLAELYSAFTGTSTLMLTAVIILMLVNWSIESLKWRLCMKMISPMSFQGSTRAVLAGNSLALITPNRTGEYFGRMVYLPKKQMLQSVPLTFLCSFAQVLITVIAGGTGLYFSQQRIISHFDNNEGIGTFLNFALWLTLVLALFLTILYFRLPLLARKAPAVRWINGWLRHARVLEDTNATILLSILSLSLIRYLVFVVQYFILFEVFGVEVDWWQAFWAVSVVFLVIAVIPSMGFLSELGVRWQASIQFMQLYSSNITGIFATSLVIWIINLVIPAIFGGLLLMSLKLFRKT